MYEIKSSINFGFYFLAASIIALLLSISSVFQLTAWLESIEMTLILLVVFAVVFNLLQTLLGKRTASWCTNGLSYYTFFGAQRYAPIEFIQQIKVHRFLCCKFTHVKLEQKSIFLLSCKLNTQQKAQLKQLGYSAG